MEITFHYTAEDIKTYYEEYAAATKPYRIGRKSSRLGRRAAYYAAVMSVPLTVLFAVNSTYSDWGFPAAALSILLWVPIVNVFWKRADIGRLAEYAAFQGERTLRLEAKGLVGRGPDGEFLRYWSHYMDIVLTKNHILFCAGRSALPLPRRVFLDAKDAQHFFDTAVAFWRAAQSPPASETGA